MVLGLIADSPDQPRRARFLDAAGEERGRLSGPRRGSGRWAVGITDNPASLGHPLHHRTGRDDDLHVPERIGLDHDAPEGRGRMKATPIAAVPTLRKGN